MKLRSFVVASAALCSLAATANAGDISDVFGRSSNLKAANAARICTHLAPNPKWGTCGPDRRTQGLYSHEYARTVGPEHHMKKAAD